MASEAADKGLQLMKNLLRGPSHDIKIHHEIKGVFLGLKPVVRTALAERNSLDRRTVETFGVHPSVYRRALRPEVRNYHFFRSGVNQRLKEIDRISLELIRELQFKHPQSIRDSDVVKEFITAPGKPYNEQIDAFARAVLEVLADRTLAARLSGEAERYAHSWASARMAERLAQLYQELASARNAAMAVAN